MTCELPSPRVQDPRPPKEQLIIFGQSKIKSYPTDVAAGEFFDSLDVGETGRREVLEEAGLRDVRHPSREGLVLDGALREHLERGRIGVQNLAVVLVGHAQLHLLEVRQHVQLGEVECGEVVDAVGVAHRHDVQPAASARAACCGAILMTRRPQLVSHLIHQLSREGTRSDPRGVGLHDTYTIIIVSERV